MYIRYSQEAKEKALKMYRETKDIQACAAIAGVKMGTVYNWIMKENKTFPRKPIKAHKQLIASSIDDQFCVQLRSNAEKKIENHQLQLTYLLDGFLAKIKEITGLEYKRQS